MNKLFYGAIVILALIIHSQFLMSFKSSINESPHNVVVKKVKDFQLQKKDTLVVLKSNQTHQEKN